jgi:hypothetical protein
MNQANHTRTARGAETVKACGYLLFNSIAVNLIRRRLAAKLFKHMPVVHNRLHQ